MILFWHLGYPVGLRKPTRTSSQDSQCMTKIQTEHLPNTSHHPAANGLVERFHRTLKAAIMCHADQHWTAALPLVLLGIRTAFKEDLQASVAELVYGEPLRIPGELLTPTADPVDPAHLITELRQHMARLRPVPATRQASPATFVQSELEKCTHVLLRQDTTRRALEPPYSGPYQVLSRREKIMKILVRGRPVTVSNDRVKPAYMPKEASRGTTDKTFNPAADATPATGPQAVPPPTIIRTTRSGRHVRFPARFKGWATISAGGWCGNQPYTRSEC
jgi:cleavage and polyadenylation specificity factor subunit 1